MKSSVALSMNSRTLASISMSPRSQVCGHSNCRLLGTGVFVRRKPDRCRAKPDNPLVWFFHALVCWLKWSKGRGGAKKIRELEQ
jgi:hypothetical protein